MLPPALVKPDNFSGSAGRFFIHILDNDRSIVKVSYAAGGLRQSGAPDGLRDAASFIKNWLLLHPRDGAQII